MRSRYTAYHQHHYQYLIDTHKSLNSPLLSLDDYDQDITWLGLRVLNTLKGTTTDTTGQVEFIAFYQTPLSAASNLKFNQIHEQSDFVKINDRWFYQSGIALPDVKISRNEACFCSSGKKFKKCHAY